MGNWLKVVEQVARLAGGEALSRFRAAALEVETKPDGSPVTAADRATEQVARDFITRNFPEDGIVGEELGVTRPAARRRWYLDPIDGTRAFVRGVPLWGTLVAVVEDETVLAGAIYCPAVDECVVAERGAGCFWNGRPTRVSEVASLAAATILTTDVQSPTPGLDRLLRQGAMSRTWGDCYGYVLVATGRAEVMVDLIMNPWDSAALQPIIEEAGGVFTDLAGNATAFGGSSLACNAKLAVQVQQLLAGTGLLTVVTQDARTGEVLMVAHTDAEALAASARTGEMHYHSRKRGLWHKGATSGNIQKVVSLDYDCDADAILARVIPKGPACHTGARTCFHEAPAPDALTALDRTIAARAAAPAAGSYTQKLLADRNLRLKKLGEETAELLVALAEPDGARAREEAADLVYHLLVALRPLGLGLDDIREVLERRQR